MMINSSHIAEALNVPHRKASGTMCTIASVTKITMMKPKNNPRIQLAPVKHFDIDEAIQAMSSIKPTPVRLHIVEELKQIKEFYNEQLQSVHRM